MAHFNIEKNYLGGAFVCWLASGVLKFLYKFTICGASVISNIYGHIENKKIEIFE